MYNKENLTKLKKMDNLAPEVMKAFWAFDKLAVADGAIPIKYKELIAIAVALTTSARTASKSTAATRAELVQPKQKLPSLRWSPLPCEREPQLHTRRTLCRIELAPLNA